MRKHGTIPSEFIFGIRFSESVNIHHL